MLIYGIWATGPMLFTQGLGYGQLIALLDVIAQIEYAAMSLMDNSASIFTSGMGVVELASLLNIETRATKRLKLDAQPPSFVEGADATKVAAFVEGATFGPSDEVPILDGLTVYKAPANGSVPTDAEDLERVVQGVLPAGGLISVLTAGTADPMCARMLMKLLVKEVEPDRGIALCPSPLQVELVSSTAAGGDVMRATLDHNLTYATGNDTSRVVSDKQLYELCTRVGMSSALLGSTYSPGWSMKQVKPKTHRNVADLDKILLVRAVVRRPSILLLNQVGDAWGAEDKLKLGDVVRGYLDGSLDDCLGAAPEAMRASRTVLW